VVQATQEEEEEDCQYSPIYTSIKYSKDNQLLELLKTMLSKSNTHNSLVINHSLASYTAHL